MRIPRILIPCLPPLLLLSGLLANEDFTLVVQEEKIELAIDNTIGITKGKESLALCFTHSRSIIGPTLVTFSDYDFVYRNGNEVSTGTSTVLYVIFIYFPIRIVS